MVLVDSSVQGTRPAPVLEASITQEYLKFVPAVTVVSPGAKITFSNRDGWDHHIILGLMGAGASIWTRGRTPRCASRAAPACAPPARPGLPQPAPTLLGCHIHGSMRAYLRGRLALGQAHEQRGQGGGAGPARGPVRVRVWHADQLVEGAAVSAQVAATGNALVVNTQIAPQRRRTAQNSTTTDL